LHIPYRFVKCKKSHGTLSLFSQPALFYFEDESQISKARIKKCTKILGLTLFFFSAHGRWGGQEEDDGTGVQGS
jgi:hypothetical protein